jgi:hypothetical protein
MAGSENYLPFLFQHEREKMDKQTKMSEPVPAPETPVQAMLRECRERAAAIDEEIPRRQGLIVEANRAAERAEVDKSAAEKSRREAKNNRDYSLVEGKSTKSYDEDIAAADRALAAIEARLADAKTIRDGNQVKVDAGRNERAEVVKKKAGFELIDRFVDDFNGHMTAISTALPEMLRLAQEADFAAFPAAVQSLRLFTIDIDLEQLKKPGRRPTITFLK